MVYYFKSSTGKVIYVGKDKFENEDLIAWAWPEDVWFHVDNYSSAHVYLRLDSPVGKLADLDPKVDNLFRILKLFLSNNLKNRNIQ